MHVPMQPARRAARLAALYDRAATTWHEGLTRLGYPAAYRHLVGSGTHHSAARVIDVGAGSGLLAETWVQAAGRPLTLALLDPSADMLARADCRLRAEGIAPRLLLDGIGCEAVKLGSADVVLCAHVLEHLDTPLAALIWMRERLCPGGQVFLAVSRPHWCTALLRWKWGHRAYRPEEMTGLLEEAGFAGIETVPFPSGPPSRTSMGYRAQRPP